MGKTKAEAIAYWNNSEWSNSTGFIVSADNEIHDWNTSGTVVYMSRWQCMMFSRFAEPGINAGKNVNVSFYAIGDIPRWNYTNPDDEPNDWSSQGDNIVHGTAVLLEEFTGIEKAYNYDLSEWYGSDESAPLQPWAPYGGPSSGYEMKAILTVEEWAVAGGSEFQ